MGLWAGAEIKSFPESQISYSAVNGLLFLWTDVFGTAAVGIAACREAIGDIGNARLRGMWPEIVQPLNCLEGRAGMFSGYGNTRCGCQIRLRGKLNRSCTGDRRCQDTGNVYERDKQKNFAEFFAGQSATRFSGGSVISFLSKCF
jgi:hypothetical protein